MFSILPLKAILIRALLARLALIRHQQRARRSHLARSPRVRLESRRTQEPWRIGLPTRSLTRYKKISAGFIDRSDCGSQSVQHGMSALVNCRHSTGPGAFPLYPRKQTSELSSVTSALGQERTHALRQIRGIETHCQSCSWSSNAFASFKSGASNPSVNQP